MKTKVYIPKRCDCCRRGFEVGDKAILHNDNYSDWFFCSDECYAKWLRVFKVKMDIVVGVEMPEIDTDDEMEEFY